MAAVHLWGALRPAAGGAEVVELQARTIRELLRKLDEQYPLMAEHLEQGVAVSLDGVIYRDSWDKQIEPGAQIYLLPRIEGG